MSLLVMNVLIAGNCLAESEIMSVAVFQRRPRSPTLFSGHWPCNFLEPFAVC